MSDLVSKNKLRDFAEQVNGIRPTERSLRGVVDNLINNYKGGGGTNIIINPILKAPSQELQEVTSIQVGEEQYLVAQRTKTMPLNNQITTESLTYLIEEQFEKTADEIVIPNESISLEIRTSSTDNDFSIMITPTFVGVYGLENANTIILDGSTDILSEILGNEEVIALIDGTYTNKDIDIQLCSFYNESIGERILPNPYIMAFITPKNV